MAQIVRSLSVDSIIVTRAADLANEALAHAIENREWRDYTGYLQDSLVWAIYIDGQLKRYSYLKPKQYDFALGKRKRTRKYREPRSYVMSVLMKKKGVSTSGLCIRFIAAMPYASGSNFKGRVIPHQPVIQHAMKYFKENLHRIT